MSRNLNAREHEILRLIAAGKSNAEIGKALFLTEGTVKWYNRQIFNKLGASNRVDALRIAGLAGASAPAPSRSFAALTLIGRERELATGRALFEQNQLITILAPGGMGKTALARALAHQLQPQFADGVFEVSLVAAQESEDLMRGIAGAAGVPISGGVPAHVQLVHALRGKRMLLLLDNFDTLIDAAPALQSLLEGAPQLQVLITSRQRLGLQGEAIIRLEGLQAPSTSGEVANPCVQLFVQQATRVAGTLPMDAPNLMQIARICRLAEGMPLAIILAASWAAAMPLAEIVHELSKGQDLLTATLRDLPKRQQNMQAVVEQSWTRLAEHERSTFACLSVFRDSFTREAAQAVAGLTPATLMALMDHALLRREEERYSVHELLRQFGARKLTEARAEAPARARHAQYFLSTSFLAAMTHADSAADFENLRTAWAAAVDMRDADALTVATPLVERYCTAHGRMLEFAQMADAAARLDASDAARAELLAASARAHCEVGAFAAADAQFSALLKLAGTSPSQRLVALLGRADVHRRSDWLTTAHQHAESALALAIELDNPRAQVEALFQRGHARWYAGGHDAYDILVRAEALSQSLESNAPERLHAQYGLASACISTGRFTEGQTHFGRALVFARELGQLGYVAETLEMQGWTWHSAGEFLRAKPLFEEACRITEAANLHWTSTTALAGLAHCVAVLGEYEVAEAMARRALTLADQIGVRRHRAMCRYALGFTLSLRGQLKEAEQLHRQAMALLEETQFGWLTGIAPEWAATCVEAGAAASLDEVERVLQNSRTMAKLHRGYTLHVLSALCRVRLQQRDYGLVLDLVAEASLFCTERGLTSRLAEFSLFEARALLGLGRNDDARLALNTATRLVQSSGWLHVAVATRQLLAGLRA